MRLWRAAGALAVTGGRIWVGLIYDKVACESLSDLNPSTCLAHAGSRVMFLSDVGLINPPILT